MRTDRLRILADTIEKLPHMDHQEGRPDDPFDLAFDLSTFEHRFRWSSRGRCGTVCCIAGHAGLLWSHATPYSPKKEPVFAGGHILGLDWEVAWKLFASDAHAYYGRPMTRTTSAQAAYVLRRMASLHEQGEVVDADTVTQLWGQAFELEAVLEQAQYEQLRDEEPEPAATELGVPEELRFTPIVAGVGTVGELARQIGEGDMY